jgi:hypothetical protein
MTAGYIYPNVKNILSGLRTGVCDVYVKTNTEDANGLVRQTEEQIYSQIPCNVSADSVTQSGDGIVSDIDKRITLFLDMEYTIPNGSKIVITQHGRTAEYTNSGEPDYYLSHQEIPLRLIDTEA